MTTSAIPVAPSSAPVLPNDEATREAWRAAGWAEVVWPVARGTSALLIDSMIDQKLIHRSGVWREQEAPHGSICGDGNPMVGLWLPKNWVAREVVDEVYALLESRGGVEGTVCGIVVDDTAYAAIWSQGPDVCDWPVVSFRQLLPLPGPPAG